MHDPHTLQRFRDAQALYQQERWAEALRIFDDLSLAYRTNCEILLNRAMCLARLGNEEEAELLCDHITIVHKDPRGAQLKAEIPTWKREGKTAPIEKPARKPILSPEATKRGIVICFLASLCLAAWTFYKNYEAPTPAPIATMPAPGERVLRFPDNASVGTLFIRDWGYTSNPQGDHTGNWQPLTEARGKVTIPAGKEVRLTIESTQAGQIAALRRLHANDLQELSMNNCPVTDADMEYIRHLTGLFLLSLDETPIGPAGYAQLLRMTSLREFSFTGTKLGEAGLKLLAQQPYLESIDADRTDLDDAWLAGLPPMDKLLFLSLDNIPAITDVGAEYIARHRNLRELFLSYTGVTDAGLKHVQSLPQLKRAWFEGTKVTDAAMAGFRLMPNIDNIGVAYTEVSTEGLMQLSGIRTLKKVGIIGCTKISADGIRRFKAQNPNCEVETNLKI